MKCQTSKFCIQGGSILLPDGEIQETDILISDGKIDDIGSSPNKTVERLNASGCMVLP